MNSHDIKNLLNTRMTDLDLYERRPGKFQVIIPIRHEDGDMLDIYFQASPAGTNMIRICDFGMTLMRLSYTYEISTPARQKILDNILINNGISNDDGNLHLDVPMDTIHEGLLQFAGCVQKICNMRYWGRETVRATFYRDLGEHITTKLTTFDPAPDMRPLSEFPIGVDWLLTHNKKSLYVFGVRGNDRAKNVAIALLEFQMAKLSYISLVVHENMEDLGKNDRVFLTRNADNQYPALDAFVDKGAADIQRMTA